MFAIIYHTNI